MEFPIGGLNPKITGCNEVVLFFIGVAKWKGVIFGLCPGFFSEALFPEWSFLRNAGEWAEWVGEREFKRPLVPK